MQAYFIIAYRTLTDATLIDESSRSSGGDTNVQVPVAALAGVDASVGGVSDVGATAMHGGTTERGEHFIREGERVYAVCCRKVKLSMVNGLVADARLDSKDFWTSYYLTRSANLTHASLAEDTVEEDTSQCKRVWKSAEGDVFETLHSDEENGDNDDDDNE